VSIGVAGAAATASRARGDEGLEAGSFDGDHQTGIGAELPGAHGQRRDERAAEIGAAGGQGAVEQKYRVDGTHLGVDRDGFGAARRRGDESRSRSTGSREADGLDARVGHEGDAEFWTRPEEQ
jgi:hypothetical protein